MIARAGIVAALALGLAACGGNNEPGADAADATATTAAEPAATVAKTGEELFKKCAVCHTITPDGRNGIGPGLHGVVGRNVASAEGFVYSTAMKANVGTWDEATLDGFITAPAKAVPGTKMLFAGISDAADRKALIDYLSAQK
jgi:cytochrome c